MSSSRRPSSARPTASSRRSSAASEHKSSSLDIKSKAKEAIQDSGEFTYECKAGFLTVAEDITSSLDSRKQLLEALQQTGRNLSSKKLDKLWESNKGNISFDQFVDICRDIKPTTEDDLMAAFKKIDRNSDGFISNNELFKVMCNKGEKMTKDEVQKIIDEVDEDGNGKLDYKEFCNMMLNTQEEAKKVAKRRMEKKEKRKATKPDASPGSARKSKKMDTSEENGEPSENVLKTGSQVSLIASKADLKQNGMGSTVSIKSSSQEKETEKETVSAVEEKETTESNAMGSQTSVKSSSTLKASDQNEADVKMGSQVSLKSSKSEKTKSDDMGSKVSLKPLKQEKQGEDLGSKVSLKPSKEEKQGEEMGSKVSLKSAKVEKQSEDMGSKVSLKSARGEKPAANNEMGSQVSIKSSRSEKKNESMGSQLFMKASTSAKPTKQDPMGSQVSIKSNASARSRRHEKTGSTTSLRALVEKDSKDERVTAEETAEVKNAADEYDGPAAAAKNGATDSDKDEDTQEKDKEEDEDSDDDDIVVGSKVSLQKKSSKNEKSPSPNNKERKERSKSPVITPDKKLKLSEPKKLKDWNYCHYKGCFFMEEKDQIVSHYYSLVIPEDTSVWITIQSFGLRPGADLTCLREGLPPLDTMLFLLRDQPDKDGNVLVTFTRHRDSKGKYGLRCDLPKGKYKLIPFTTGCRFQSRKSEPKIETKLVKKDKEGKFVLTKAFKEVLLDVFEVCDLDGNGTLSREEFSLYNVRTSGEEVADEEWDVVEENVELRKNELTHKGFLDLNQLEAEDNQGDTEDFWVTLQSMGYNKGLIMDEACPYKIEVYTEDCEADLKVIGLTSDNRYMESVLAQAVIRQGDGTKVKNAKDLFLHVFSNNFWACLVLYNKSYSDVTVEVDCSSSENVSTNRRNFKQISKVPAKSAIISQHLLPEDESKNWTIRWMEQIIK